MGYQEVLGKRNFKKVPAESLEQLYKHPVLSMLFITGVSTIQAHQKQGLVRTADDYLLVYCNKGKIKISIGSANYLLDKKGMLVVSMESSFSYQNTESVPGSLNIIHFNGSAADRFAKDLVRNANGHLVTLQDDEDLGCKTKLEGMLGKNSSTEDWLLLNRQFWHLLTGLCFSSQHKCTQWEISKSEMAIRFMSSQIHLPLSLAEIASHVHLSVSHFSFQFKKETGYTPLDYFNQLKVRKACHQLENSGLRIKEIASNLGYNDPLYFSRLFSKLMDESPVSYRKRRQKKQVSYSLQ